MLLSTAKPPAGPTPIYLNFVAAGATPVDTLTGLFSGSLTDLATDYYVHAVASQQASSVTLTLQRQDPNNQHNNDTVRVQVTTGPISTPTNSSLGFLTPLGAATYSGFAGGLSPNPGVSAEPGVQYQPVNETVTFPPGVTTEPVTIPIVAGAANPGMVSFQVTATQLGVTAQPNKQPFGDQTIEQVFLTQNINASVPRIVGAQMVSSGGRATDFILQFNMPMDPATVEKIYAYGPSDISYHHHRASLFDFSLPFGVPDDYYYSSPVNIKKATYNPSTNTVDLHLAKSVDARDVYQIASTYAEGGGPGALLDAAGTPINEDGTGLGGGFVVTLSNKQTKIYDGVTQTVIPTTPPAPSKR